ncbi:GRAM domain-containing protein 2A [Bienertia sinuspersici]
MKSLGKWKLEQQALYLSGRLKLKRNVWLCTGTNMDSLEHAHPVLSMDILREHVFPRLDPDGTRAASNIMMLHMFTKLDWGTRDVVAETYNYNSSGVVDDFVNNEDSTDYCDGFPLLYGDDPYELLANIVVNALGDIVRDIELDIAPCIILHHGGNWINNPNLNYVEGQVEVVNELSDDFDGYSNVRKLHYCDPLKNLLNGVRILSYDDFTFTKFKSLLFRYKIIDVLTEHDEDVQEFQIPSCSNQMISIEVFEPLQDDIDYDVDGSDNDDDEVKDARKKIKVYSNTKFEFTQELESLNRLAVRSGECNLEVTCDDGEDSNSDLDSPPPSDSEEDCGYLLPEPKKKRTTKPKFNLNAPLRGKAEVDSPFYLGQELEDAIQLRSAITSYYVSIGRDVQYTKNDKKRIGVRCKGKDCQWYLWASLEGGKGTMTVKTHISQYNCGRLAKVSKMRANWIVKHYHSKFNVNPYLKCQEIVDTVWTKRGIKNHIMADFKS